VRLLKLSRGIDFANHKSSVASDKTYRSFNLGKIENTDISIWLEVTKGANLNQLNLRIRNEGKESVSNLSLNVKTSSQIVIINRGEIFGTSKKREVIKILPSRKSVNYSTMVKIAEDLKPAQISVEVSKNLKGDQTQTLTADLTLTP
jgi:hypothetical protein